VVETRYIRCRVIELECGYVEREMLFSRGNLCRVNPMSARGMKKDLKTIRGVNR
jgi:hypothetical protein